MLTRHVAVVSLSAVVLLSAATAATRAAITADAVVSYDPGTGAKAAYWGAPLTDPAAALGLPAANHDLNDLYQGDSQIAFADHSALTPFSPAFTPTEVVSFGAGGHLTLHLSSPVPTTGGATLGVHTGTGLNDFAWPAGHNFPDASTFTDNRVATVEVSADNAAWYSLGGPVTFNLPTNYFAAGISDPYGNGPGSALADFSKPFTGHLADFDNLDWQGTLALLDGSAGGTWLDLSAAPGVPASIQYVRFSLPAGSPDTFVLDSLTAVPEPASLSLTLLGLPFLRRRRTH
jgi:hypothetical protein